MDAKTKKELAVDLAKTFLIAFVRQEHTAPIKSEDLPAILKNAYKAVKDMDS